VPGRIYRVSYIAKNAVRCVTNKPGIALILTFILAFNAFPTSRPLPPDDIDAAVTDSEPETSDSEDVTEDEDGVELTPALDAAIMRTLGMIRRKEGVYGDEQVLQGVFSS
jgi:hypothetical protein